MTVDQSATARPPCPAGSRLQSSSHLDASPGKGSASSRRLSAPPFTPEEAMTSYRATQCFAIAGQVFALALLAGSAQAMHAPPSATALDCEAMLASFKHLAPAIRTTARAE